MSNPVVLITGALTGIGRATAELLSEQGAKVLINDLDGDVAEQTASEIAGETVVHGGDLTKEGAADALVQTAIDAWGKIDIIVNNAGYTWDSVIQKMTDEQFQAIMDVHVVAPDARPLERVLVDTLEVRGAEVREGVGGVKPLSDSDREEIKGNIATAATAAPRTLPAGAPVTVSIDTTTYRPFPHKNKYGKDYPPGAGTDDERY